MKHRILSYSAILIIAVAMTACGVTKYLPEDSYMLTNIKVKSDRKSPKSERIPGSEMEKYVPQRATKKFLGTDLPAALYLSADPEKDTGWARFMRNLGSEPVILDTMQAHIGARNLKLYMNSRGFYESDSDYEIKYKDKKKKAKVKYTVQQGEPYRIRNISYDFRDSFLEQVIRGDSAETLLASGDIFDANVMRDERQRIADNLHNSGYYNFSINNITFKADTTVGDHLADITMVVRQHLAGYDEKGTPIYENNSIYSIKDIYVFPDYDPTLAATDSTYMQQLDTVTYRGLKVINTDTPKIKPPALRRAISIYPDYLYSYDQVQRTYNGILSLPYYKSARIVFDDTQVGEEGFVTFVGGDDEIAEEAAHTSEKQLNCNIYCTPALKQAYTVDLEASTTSAFYGIKGSATYTNRNLFRGAEVFNIGINGGYEFYPKAKSSTISKPNSFEIGASTSIVFPRFITPFPVDRANRATRPLTKLELSFNMQRRPYYHRTITGGSFAYTWSNSRYSSYGFRPIDINVVKVSYIDPDFLTSIQDQNPYLKNSYESQLVPAIGFSYVYANPKISSKGNSLTFRLNLELAGNISNLLSMAFLQKVPNQTDTDIVEMVYKPFGIPFSQYFRVETSISNSIVFGPKTAFVYRFLAGVGLPYGNSTAIPLDRQFYSGGSNSMRGWTVRSLGPGGTSKGDIKAYASQTSNMKLEANVELRFPLWNALRGAIFMDAGNIWQINIKGSQSQDPAVFNFGTFLPQIGLNTGIGLRFDVGVAVIRLDWGIILHDPNEAAGSRWIHNFKFANTALSFGVGYPF